MATVQELAQAVADIKTVLAPLPAAIDALEAKITAAAGVLTPEQQAAIDAAMEDVKAISGGIAAAIADATDNVDEGAGGGGGGPT